MSYFKMNLAASLAFVVLSLAVGLAAADEAVLAPSQATVLPSDASGLTRIVLQYDLSGLRSGEGRQIDAALLDWHLTGVSASHDSEFQAFAATVSWTAANAANSGVGQIASNAEPVSEWEFTTEDYDRNDGGFVRFNFRSLATAWADETLPNYGVVITTDDVNRANALASLPSAILTVRYGFSK